MRCIVPYLITHEGIQCHASYLGASKGYMEVKNLDPTVQEALRRRLPYLGLKQQDMDKCTVPIYYHHIKEFGSVQADIQKKLQPCLGYAGKTHKNQVLAPPFGVMAYLSSFIGNTFGILPGTNICQTCIGVLRKGDLLNPPSEPRKRKRKTGNADTEYENEPNVNVQKYTKFNNILMIAGIKPMEARKRETQTRLKTRAGRKIEALIKFCVDSLAENDDLALEYETVRNSAPKLREVQSTLEDVMSSLKTKYLAATKYSEKIDVLMHAPRNWIQARTMDYFSTPEVKCPLNHVQAAAEKRRDKMKHVEESNPDPYQDADSDSDKA